MKTQKLPEKDLLTAYKFSKLYGCDKSFRYFKDKYKANSGLFVVSYESRKLVGVCWGFSLGKEVRLIHMTVDAGHWKKGIGKMGAARKPTDVVGFYGESGYRVVKEKSKYVVMEKKI